MVKAKYRARIEKVVKSAEATFGQQVERVSAPGGEGRASYRVFFKDRVVFATLRPNFRRTHLEAHVLERLSKVSDLQPAFIALDDDILYQSDVGGTRLNLAISDAKAGARENLAAAAITSIFRIQSAARAVGLNNDVPHLGQNDAWLENLATGPHFLDEFSEGHAHSVNPAELMQALAHPGVQFVKWDCRSGNAALAGDIEGRATKVRWFDFEYCGARHGAEDIAWLIGDEAWPLPPDQMEAIVRDSFDPNCGHILDDYLSYLATYLTCHCAQRLGLIVKEARKRGWISKAQIRQYDDAGVHPEFAVQICRVAQYFGDRNPLTRPIARDFAAAERVFLDVLMDGHATAAAAQ